MNIYAAIEIGSGKTRLCIAEIADSSIEKIYFEKEEELHFADYAHQHQGILDEEILKKAIEVLSGYKQIATQFNVQKIKCIATDIFRDTQKASSGKEFIHELSQKLDIHIQIIDQQREGLLGFLTISHIIRHYQPPIVNTDLIAWDSGRSSAQLTMKHNHTFEVYQNSFGVIPIQRVLEEIRKTRGQPQTSLIPISSDEIQTTIDHLKLQAEEISPSMVDKISSGVVVRKYGSKMLVRAFQVDALRLLEKEEIKDILKQFSGKTEHDIISITGGHQDVDPSMLIMSLLGMYAIMDKFGINSIRFVQTPAGNTYGLLLENL